MNDSIEKTCVRLFREVVGLAHTVPIARWPDARLLVEPIEAMAVDSLQFLDFVMQVESAYDVQLDEGSVNDCNNIGEFAALVAVEVDKDKPAGALMGPTS